MKITRLAAMAVLGFGLGLGAAHAEGADVSTMTCADLASMKPEDIAFVFAWIDGYMGGSASDATLDMERLTGNMDGASAACSADPTRSVMEVLDEVENGAGE